MPTSQVCPPLLSPVVGRPVFRLVCSELNSRALLSNRYFVLINRKKMKQEPAQKVGSWLGEGWRAGRAKWCAVEQGGVFSAQMVLIFLVWDQEKEERGKLSVAHLLGVVIKANTITCIPHGKAQRQAPQFTASKDGSHLDSS